MPKSYIYVFLTGYHQQVSSGELGKAIWHQLLQNQTLFKQLLLNYMKVWLAALGTEVRVSRTEKFHHWVVSQPTKLSINCYGFGCKMPLPPTNKKCISALKSYSVKLGCKGADFHESRIHIDPAFTHFMTHLSSAETCGPALNYTTAGWINRLLTGKIF